MALKDLPEPAQVLVTIAVEFQETVLEIKQISEMRPLAEATAGGAVIPGWSMLALVMVAGSEGSVARGADLREIYRRTRRATGDLKKRFSYRDTALLRYFMPLPGNAPKALTSNAAEELIQGLGASGQIARDLRTWLTSPLFARGVEGQLEKMVCEVGELRRTRADADDVGPRSVVDEDADANLGVPKDALRMEQPQSAPYSPTQDLHGTEVEGLLNSWRGLVTQHEGGVLPVVSGLDPYRLGATPTAFGSVGKYGTRDTYVARAGVDQRLDAALVDDRLVLLRGPSKVGKTRALFESMRRVLPDARVIVPEPGTMHAIAGHRLFTEPSNVDVVVWLDDLDDYLMAAVPLTPVLLADLVGRGPGRTVVVATIRREARARLGAAAGPGARGVRAVLEHAETIDVSSTIADGAEHDQAVSLYPDLRLDLYRRQGYGLAEVLAGAPALLAQYVDADCALASVITTAIDWRRVHRGVTIPEPVLHRLAWSAAKRRCPHHDVSAEAITAAIVTARQPVEDAGHIAALRTRWDSRLKYRSYRAFDYLVDADDGEHGRPRRPIDKEFWDQVAVDAEPDTLNSMSHWAVYYNESAIAEQLARRAAAADHPGAFVHMGMMLYHRGDREDARVHWKRGAEDFAEPEAMYGYGMILAEDGDHEGALRLWTTAAQDHGHAFAMSALGTLALRQGDIATARRWWEQAALLDCEPAQRYLRRLDSHSSADQTLATD